MRTCFTPSFRFSLLLVALFVVLNGLGAKSQAQTTAVQPQITTAIDDARVLKVPSTHPLARAGNDLGLVPGNLSMQRMLLVLKPSAAQQASLRKLLDEQQNKNSANYHAWLTPEQFSQRFAPAPSDIQKVAGWLTQYGFQVAKTSRGGQWIEFSGSAQQVESAFHTEIHTYDVHGEKHIANSRDISVPQALAPVVAGVLSLHNFEKPAAHVRVGAAKQDISKRTLVGVSPVHSGASANPLPKNITLAGPAGYAHLLAPGDYTKIYNSLPLLQSGINGSGVAIAVVGRTDIELSDVQAFRKIFNLPSNDAVFITNGPDPGFTGDEIESDLDVEWSGAVAPNATIDFVTSATTATTDGIDLSEAYVVDNALAPIMTVSYGQCEAYIGPAGNLFENSLNQQAAAEGISTFVSSGDNGSAACDDPSAGAPAVNGFNVSGLASTPYNTAVGGTQFAENGLSGNYWSATNDANQTSALGYIPEAIWNESCDPTIDPNQCGGSGSYSLAAGSGGPSNCSDVHWTLDANGNVTQITCQAGYAKPAWQAGAGVPSDGVRDVPDLALAAAGGHDGYIFCSDYGYPFFDLTCQSTVDQGQTVITNAGIVGGTSAAAPSMAGIMALVEQKNGVWAGLANYNFYKLAAADKLASCNSTNLTDPSTPSTCVFHDVTAGNNATPCVGGSPDCSSSDPNTSGVLTGFAATTGYDYASGLGSVDAANLVAAWGTATPLATSTTLSSTATTVVHGQPLSLNVAVTPTSGTGVPSGDFVLVTDNSGDVSGATLNNGSFSGSVNSLPGGSHSFHAHYSGDAMFAASDSSAANVTVTPEDCVLTLAPYYANFLNELVPLVGNVVYGAPIVIDASAAGKSGIGNATGTVTILLDGKTTLGVFPLYGKGDTNLYQVDTGIASGILPGSHTISATYSGDNSFNPSSSASFPFTVIKVTPDSHVSALATTVTAGKPVTFNVVIGAAGLSLPTGSVQLVDETTGLPIGGVLTLSSSGGLSQASLTTSSLAPGSYDIHASYSGDSNYNPVDGSSHFAAGVVITVNAASGAADVVSLTGTPTTVALGQSSNYVIRVQPATAGGPAPTGTVLLLGENGTFGSGNPVPLINGSATFVLPWYHAGSYSLYANYSGDSTYTAQQSSAVTTVVNPGTPAVVLTAAATSVLPNTQTSLNVVLTGSTNQNLSAPYGQVQFLDSVNGAAAKPLGQPQYLTVGQGYNVVFSLPVTLPTGTNAITAQYLGGSDWAATTSNSVSVLVSSPDFTFNPSSTSLNISAGSTGTTTFEVDPILGFPGSIALSCGSGVPAGSTCSFSPSTLTPNGANQTATLSLTTLAPSQSTTTAALHRSLSWAFSGGTGLAGLLLFGFPGRRRRMKDICMLMVACGITFVAGCGGNSKPTTTLLQISSSSTKAASGSSVTLNASLNALHSNPTGTVTFYDGTTALGQAVQLNKGVASLQAASLAVGGHAISAKYSGDSHNDAATSQTMTQVITGTTTLQVNASSGSIVHETTLTINLQ